MLFSLAFPTRHCPPWNHDASNWTCITKWSGLWNKFERLWYTIMASNLFWCLRLLTVKFNALNHSSQPLLRTFFSKVYSLFHFPYIDFVLVLAQTMQPLVFSNCIPKAWFRYSFQVPKLLEEKVIPAVFMPSWSNVPENDFSGSAV